MAGNASYTRGPTTTTLDVTHAVRTAIRPDSPEVERNEHTPCASPCERSFVGAALRMR
jgi:hypothetical protein